MAKDLKRELPDTDGFSRTNLFSMRKLYLFYYGSELVHQIGGQLVGLHYHNSNDQTINVSPL